MDFYDRDVLIETVDRLGLWIGLGMLAAGTVVAVALIFTHGVA